MLRDLQRRVERLRDTRYVTGTEGEDDDGLRQMLTAQGMDPTPYLTPDGTVIVDGDTATYLQLLQLVATSPKGTP